MGSRRRAAFTRSQCFVSSFSSARSFFRSASHWSRETIGGCGVVLVVIYGLSFYLVSWQPQARLSHLRDPFGLPAGQVSFPNPICAPMAFHGRRRTRTDR